MTRVQSGIQWNQFKYNFYHRFHIGHSAHCTPHKNQTEKRSNLVDYWKKIKVFNLTTQFLCIFLSSMTKFSNADKVTHTPSKFFHWMKNLLNILVVCCQSNKKIQTNRSMEISATNATKKVKSEKKNLSPNVLHCFVLFPVDFLLLWWNMTKK